MALPRRVHQPDRPVVEAEKTHRGHAAIKQVFAELKAGPLAHMPSKSFNANGAWLAIATVAFNLTRALGVIADGRFTRAETSTIRSRLIHTPHGSPPLGEGYGCTCPPDGPGPSLGSGCGTRS